MFSLFPLAFPLILCVNVSFPAIPSGHSGSLVRSSRVYAASACAAGVRQELAMRFLNKLITLDTTTMDSAENKASPAPTTKILEPTITASKQKLSFPGSQP